MNEVTMKAVTVQYDLSAAETESQLRNKLIEMGWTPPGQNKQAEPVAQCGHESCDCRGYCQKLQTHPAPAVAQGEPVGHVVFGFVSAEGDCRQELVLRSNRFLPSGTLVYTEAPAVAVNEQVLNHTPDTDDHVGDANKIVRLTADDVMDAYSQSSLDINARLEDLFDFAHVLEDAWIKKNGG